MRRCTLCLLWVAVGLGCSTTVRAEDNVPPPGFTALFNGKDLTNWQGLVELPQRAKLSKEQLAARQKDANTRFLPHWTARDGVLHYDGKGNSLQTIKDYGDFELWVDWRILADGDSGIYLRGSPQVQIWDTAKHPEGSGGLFNNQKNPSKPIRCADRPVGEWNRFRIVMKGEKVSVWLNGELVVDNVTMENYWDRKADPSKPIPATGPIELQHHGNSLEFKNIFVKELASAAASNGGGDGGFARLFNGKDLAGWRTFLDPRAKDADPKKIWTIKDGVIQCEGSVNGYLITDKEYDNYVLRVQWRWGEKVARGRNSGVFVHVVGEDKIWPKAVEAQLMSGHAGDFWLVDNLKLKVDEARRDPKVGRHYFRCKDDVEKPLGEWNQYEITCKGDTVRLVINGELVNEGTECEVRKGKILLQSEGAEVHFRNIELKPIE